jgi:predicted RNA-binding protein YlqC (UPF0109 family)
MGEIKELLKEVVIYNASKVVDNPNDVEVDVSISTKAIIIQIKVNSSDCGKIIGKHGRSIDALKILCLNIKNTNFPDDSRRILLEVLEDENSSFKY